MTRYEVYAVVLAVVQLVVSGLGFTVVTRTLRVLIRSIDAQSSAGVAIRQLEFDKVILTYPFLYKYFYQGYDLNTNEPDYSRAMAATNCSPTTSMVTSSNRACTDKCGQTRSGKVTSKITLQRAYCFGAT